MTMDVNSEAYERQYAKDMKAISNLECCEQAGVELSQSFGRWGWRHGMRSSADQYALTFETKDEAAAHFLQSREFKDWLRARGVRV